jgi:tetratricopeptide (TPR) repeat protein
LKLFRWTSALLAALIQFASFAECSLAQEANPTSESIPPIAKSPLDTWRDEQIQVARGRDTASRGSLALQLVEALQIRITAKVFGWYGASLDFGWMRNLTTELIEVYPTLPVQNQRALAGGMLAVADFYLNPQKKVPVRTVAPHCGRSRNVEPEPIRLPDDFTSLGISLIESVLKSIETVHWIPSNTAREAMVEVLSNEIFPAQLCTRAQRFLALKQSEDTVATEKLAVSLKDRLAVCLPSKNIEHHVFSQQELDSFGGVSGFDKQQKANIAKLAPSDKIPTIESLDISIFSPADSEALSKCVDRLSICYSKLDESVRADFAGQIMDEANSLMRSNLQKNGEFLFWQVFNSVPGNWIDNSGLETGLYNNYFLQANRFPEAEKVLSKCLQVSDFNRRSIGGETNLRTILAEVYEEEGKFNEAIGQYKYVVASNKWLAQSPIFTKDSPAANEQERSSAENRIKILNAALGLRQGRNGRLTKI